MLWVRVRFAPAVAAHGGAAGAAAGVYRQGQVRRGAARGLARQQRRRQDLLLAGREVVGAGGGGVPDEHAAPRQHPRLHRGGQQG